MRLAWQCGLPHADHLLESITSEQYDDIIAFNQREPLAEFRADVRAAMVALAVARGAGIKGAKLTHFLPDYDAVPQAEQSPDEMNLVMARVAATFEAAEAKKAKCLPTSQNLPSS